ncbi:hypothetical protein FSP39_011597 [Pinctada imbricata]|uniref:Transposase n=1 Tax=Pinctada imbricata TaxID=66713 RepID=A0AA88YI87_PINIB|nr:hypothetical protein FSP39_011597 [Pinctada imbricata]
MNSSGGGPNISRSMMYEWYKRFQDGRVDIDDDERSGRVKTADKQLANDILSSLDNDRRLTALRKKRPDMAAELNRDIFHQDNAPSHTAHSTSLELSLLEFEVLEHPLYSPDLAPMDFAVFPHIKSQLRGQRFADLTELRFATRSIIKNIEESLYKSVFERWVKRHQKCVDLQGVYFEKE